MKKVFLIALIIVLVSGCARVKVPLDDKTLQENRLKERANSFYKNLVEKKIDDALKFSYTSWKNKKNITGPYIDSFKEGQHMGSYYKVDFELASFEIGDNNKARIKIKYLVQTAKDSVVSDATMYDFWVFDEGDWYFLFGGKDEFYKIK